MINCTTLVVLSGCIFFSEYRCVYVLYLFVSLCSFSSQRMLRKNRKVVLIWTSPHRQLEHVGLTTSI